MNTQVAAVQSDTHYDGYLARFQQRFLDRIAAANGLLFTTDAQGLFQTYLQALDPGVRQWHTCHSCRHFFERFGHLVTIDEEGVATPLLWEPDDSVDEVSRGVVAVRKAVAKARVTGVFYSSAKVWGTPVTGAWHHLAVTPPSSLVFSRRTQTAEQAIAEKREDMKNVGVALAEFSAEVVDQAVTLLRTEALYRSEKCLGVAEWLQKLHGIIAARKSRRVLDNLLWLEVARAPAGFCHPRSSMIGSLLEDIESGMVFDEVSRRFSAKMRPDRYQRPQAAPAAGTIAQAEKMVEQLGAASALARRFARLEEIKTIWTPRPAPAKPEGSGRVFGHLQAKGEEPREPMRVPPTTMTWSKFERMVLPEAERIEYLTGSIANYCALLTAVDADAVPIIQWDIPERRNPVSWYVYRDGSPARNWNLRAGMFHPVTAVTYQPSSWYGDHPHHGNSVIFILDGAKDLRSDEAGIGLFPEILKAEFHGIRSVIEAFSQTKNIEGRDEASACGICLQKGSHWTDRFRVTTKGQTLEYILDRWD